MKFKFNPAYSAMIGNVRVSPETHATMKRIAKEKNVTIQEVVRVFLEAALEEYNVQ